MYNVRFLKFYQWENYSPVRLPHGLKYLPDELRYLHWVGYPSKVLPSNLSLENLIELDLSHSKVERLWEGKKHAPKLKRLILSYSWYLTRIPDLSDSPCLEVINLKDCRRLLDISLSIQELLLNNCHLMEIPEDIGCLSSLERLELDGNDFGSLPKSMKQLSMLTELYVNDCNELQSLTELPPNLGYLEAMNCEQLQTPPDASEFAQVVAERCRNGVPYLHCIYMNSSKLNQKALSNILAVSLQIIQHRATAEKVKI
ncbi:hypothetical protein LWI29_014322 [Acer saccharum]|uniref:Uncharacterized protein n=1 Tax=Acer saccharum TaxID=4024 RepID=A0AA39V7P4_ACESA|nr:hypothetical protein LWI29_014322 [Acer saccharum]